MTGASIVDDDDEVEGGAGSGFSSLSFLRPKNREAAGVG